jgi:hypothetical protein
VCFRFALVLPQGFVEISERAGNFCLGVSGDIGLLDGFSIIRACLAASSRQCNNRPRPSG